MSSCYTCKPVSSRGTISVYYQNVRGLRTKLANFYNSALSRDYPVIMLTETWLNDSYYSAEVLDDRYIIYRADRDPLMSSKRRGGGVLIAVLKTLYSYQLKCSSSCEEIWVKLKVDSTELIFCAVYIPPSSDLAVYQAHLQSVDQFMNDNKESTFIIIGDYNLPGIRWVGATDGSNLNPANVCGLVHQEFCDYLSFLNLFQLNHLSNSNGNMLDLVLSNDLDVAVDKADPLIGVDTYHPPFEVVVKCSQQPKLNGRPHSVYNFSRAPFWQINYALSLIDWCFLDDDGSDIDLAVYLFYSSLSDIIDRFVPVRKLYSSSYPLWVSKATQALITLKKSAHKRYKLSHSQVDYENFSDFRQRVKQCLEADRIQYIRNTENNIISNPNKFWSFVKTTRKEAQIPNCMSFGDRLAVGGTDVCCLFAEFFYSNYAPKNLIRSPIFGSLDGLHLPDAVLSSPIISYTNISDAISLLSSSGSSGPDGIPSSFLIHCCGNLLKPLHILFNKCITSGTFPSQWKHSNVIPIFKSGLRSDIINYRPISINNNFSKLFDCILAKILTTHVEGFIDSNQHGFTAGRSTETNLFLFTNFIIDNFEKGLSVDCIYTDIKKAFDRVPIGLLIDKLHILYKISDPLLSCIRAFLDCRSQQVSINGFISNPISVSSGVGQGTHLGPVLFLLFINDLRAVFKYSQFLLFADDCKIYISTSSLDDLFALQEDLDAFVQWCTANELELNVNKCKHMRFTRKPYPLHFRFSINGLALDTVSCMKDLGVYVDSKLTFNAHIDYIANRANKLLGYIRRTTVPFSNPRCLVILYTALVRSIIEYCSVIWAPFYQIHSNRLERIQKKFIRTLCFKFGITYKSDNYDVLAGYFSLQPLAKRRVFADLMFAFKVLNGIIKCSGIGNMFTYHVPSRPLRHVPVLSVDYHRTNYGFNCPLTRISNEFNSHISDVNTLHMSRAAFRSLLCHILYS